MDENNKKAFDAAQDTIKQILTLSTAIIGGVVTFSGSGKSAIIDFKAAGWSVPTSIALFLISILFGFSALLNMTGALAQDPSPTIYKRTIRICTAAQILIFFVGISILAIFAPHWNWSALNFW